MVKKMLFSLLQLLIIVQLRALFKSQQRLAKSYTSYYCCIS